MSAPRLLDKRTVSAEVATQKAQSIKEGLNLAKKVDVLRETIGEEQEKLEKFRIETTARIQSEIDAKIRERDVILRENQKLREERQRIILDANIDLEKEWRKVEDDKKSNEIWQEKLIEEQVFLLAEKADSQVLSDATLRRVSEIKEKENITERTLIEAESKFEEASEMLDSAKSKSAAILKKANDKDKEVLIREQEVILWNNDLRTLESSLKGKEIDLSNREIALKVRYETFLKAQKYLQAKDKKL